MCAPDTLRVCFVVRFVLFRETDLCSIELCEVPTTLGQGHTGAEDKVSSAMHTMSFECWDTEMLIRYLDEIFSFTSDLGTEVKITDYKIDRSNLRTVIPDWLADRRTRSPLVEEHSTGPAPDRSPFLQCEGDNFLETLCRCQVWVI